MLIHRNGSSPITVSLFHELNLTLSPGLFIPSFERIIETQKAKLPLAGNGLDPASLSAGALAEVEIDGPVVVYDPFVALARFGRIWLQGL